MRELVVNKREERHAEELTKNHVPIAPEWFKHNLLFTLFLNASSVGIPEAERFVVSTIEEVQRSASLPTLKEEIENILHEERAHSRVHDAYNRYLASTGLSFESYLKTGLRVSAFLHRFSLKTRLAFCAMTEHFTATMAKQILDTGILEGRDVDERLDRVWTWHALEDLDHRATAFDVYLAAGGGYMRRALAGFFVSFVFLYMQHACFLNFMRQKHALWSLRVWRAGLPYLFGKRGVYRHLFMSWLRFFKPGFHPSSIAVSNRLQKQLQHYHIESELIHYFDSAPRA